MVENSLLMIARPLIFLSRSVLLAHYLNSQARSVFLKQFQAAYCNFNVSENCEMRPNRKADPAPRGAYRGRAPHLTACAPPNENCAPPPNEDCAPKKLTGSGLLERKSRSKLVFFVDEDLFFGDHLFSAGKTLWFCDFGKKIPCNFSEDLSFFSTCGHYFI